MGWTGGSYCSVCQKVLEPRKGIPRLAHTEVEVVTKAATCEEPGNALVYCSTCHKILNSHKELPVTDHKAVIDKAVAPTCEESGKTEGSHCQTCGKVLKEQKEIPALGHTETIDQKEVPATGHKEAVTDKAVEPTCETPGKTEGSHCTACGKTLKEQQEIPALGHTETMLVIKAATCEKEGMEIPYCSVCKKILGEQKEIPAIGHSFTAWTTKTAATVFKPEVQTRICDTCQKTETRDYGKKLTPYMKTSVTSLLLKTKQKTTVLKVSGLKSGDSIVSWKSSNTKVVTVSGKTNGTSTVTAGALKGTATITITLKSGLKKTVKVTVQPTTVKTTKISGIPAGVTLKKGQSRVLQQFSLR